MTDEKIKSDENLLFDKDNASRIDLFHVVKDSKGSYVHLADNGSKFNEEATQKIFNNTYRFDFDVQATSSFDMMLFGSKNAFARDSQQNSFFLNFKEDGTLSLRLNGPSNQFHFDEIFAGNSSFKMNQLNRVTFFVEKNSASRLTLRFAINNQIVKLKKDGNIAYDDSKSTITLDDKGNFILDGLLNQYGLGQRFGIYAIDDARVTISKFGYSVTKAE